MKRSIAITTLVAMTACFFVTMETSAKEVPSSVTQDMRIYQVGFIGFGPGIMIVEPLANEASPPKKKSGDDPLPPQPKKVSWSDVKSRYSK